jgi:hypothetical protein
MVKLEEIKKDSVLNGIVPGQSVRIASVDPIGNDALSVFYKDSLGKLGERMLFRSDESFLSQVETGRPWSFDGNGLDFSGRTRWTRNSGYFLRYFHARW